MLLMIDNYDSFTYNLVQYLCELGEKVLVYRNDKISLGMNDVKKVSVVKDYVFLNTGSPHHVQLVDNVEEFDVFFFFYISTEVFHNPYNALQRWRISKH